MKITRVTLLTLLLLATSCVATMPRRPNPSTVVNISPAMEQRIIVTYGNEQVHSPDEGIETFGATLVADEGEWYVEDKDGNAIDLPSSPGAFVVTGGDSPVVTLDGKPLKVTIDKNVVGSSAYSIGADVPAKDKFYIVINYLKSVIMVEVKQKVE